MSEKIKLEMHNPVPFSRSPCWDLLRQYYEQEGPKAWNQKIPYHATTNMNVAYAYAELLVAYYQDWMREHGKLDKPLHVFELGAGSGRFSYYLLIALEKVAVINDLDPACFKLVMSDFVEKNIKSWLSHPQFSDYFKRGMLDCMQFDVQAEPSMLCLYSKKKLGLEDFSMPPFVLAHYLLDSLPIDVFRVKKGAVFAVHVGLGLDKSKDYKRGDIRQVAFEKRNLKVKDRYYKNDLHNKLMKKAANSVEDGYFDFPVSAFKLLDTLEEVTGGKFMFSCIDKGYVDWDCYKHDTFPPIFYHHNAFSFDVNFCMLNEYLEQKEGSSLWFATTRQLIKWELCSCGVEMDNTPEVTRFAQLRLEQNTPADYLYMYAMACDIKFDMSFSALLSLLVQSGWDPILFAQMGPQLARKIGATSFDEQSFLFSYFDTIERNFFRASDSGDIYLTIGRLYHEMDMYEEAISYLEQSIKKFGENYSVYFALGKSYFSSGDSSTAMTMFTNAQKYKVTKQLKGWLEYFNTDSTFAKVKAKIDKKRADKAKKKAKKKKEEESEDDE